jgi:hypothetical protein
MSLFYKFSSFPNFFGKEAFLGYIFFLTSFLGTNIVALGQRPSIDSIYKKGTLGIGVISSSSISINTFFIRNFNVYTNTSGVSGSYYFQNRWSVYGSFQNYRRFSNRPERSPNLSFFFGDMQVRYHLRHWYFGAGSSLGNFSFIGHFEGDIAPRTTWIAFANAGLNVRTSTHKNFWRNTFFVVDFKLGKSLYVEPKPDGLSSIEGIRPSGYIGLRHHIYLK